MKKYLTVSEACKAIDILFNLTVKQRRVNGNSDKLVKRHYEECKGAIRTWAKVNEIKP